MKKKEKNDNEYDGRYDTIISGLSVECRLLNYFHYINSAILTDNNTNAIICDEDDLFCGSGASKQLKFKINCKKEERRNKI